MVGDDHFDISLACSITCFVNSRVVAKLNTEYGSANGQRSSSRKPTIINCY